MSNNMEESCGCGKFHSCFADAENRIHTLFCIRDNLTILSDGLALKEDSEGSNAIQLCVSSFDSALGELSEILEHLEKEYVTIPGACEDA